MTLRVIRPETSEVVRVVYDFRTLLDAHELNALSQMASWWLAVGRGLEKDISLLAEEITRRRLAGEIVTEQMIWRSERYKILQKQMEAEIEKYNSRAFDIIANGQRGAASLGIDAANASIYSALGATTRTWDRLNVNAVEAIIGFAQDKTPLQRLLKRDYPLAVDGLLKALINGVARGQSPSQTAKDMIDGTAMGFNRAVLIARTEMARAYRTGSTEQFRRSGVISGFMRLVKKETACMACLMLDGQTFALESELEDHPRGKCTAIPIVEGVPPPAWVTGEEWFRSLSADEQIAKMGHEQFEMWKDGKIRLRDFAAVRHSDVWGDQPAVPPLAELRRIAG